MISCFPVVYHRSPAHRIVRHFRRHVIGYGVAATGFVCVSVPAWLWQYTPDVSNAPVAIPEPSSVAILLAALGCMLVAKIVTRA